MCTKNTILRQYRKFCKTTENKKLFLLKQLKKFQPLTVKDNIQESKVCFVFSCPGDKELINNEVCSGDTGKNLSTLLNFLVKSDPHIFASNEKRDYTIINASNIVHFNALDERTEANKKEIMEEKNLKRITKIFKAHQEIEFVILFGKKAQLLEEKIKESKQDIKFAYAYHLGYQAINQIDLDDDNDNPREKTMKRLEKIAACISSQLAKN